MKGVDRVGWWVSNQSWREGNEQVTSERMCQEEKNSSVVAGQMKFTRLVEGKGGAHGT